MELIEHTVTGKFTLKLTDDEAKELSRKLEDPNETRISLGDLQILVEG